MGGGVEDAGSLRTNLRTRLSGNLDSAEESISRPISKTASDIFIPSAFPLFHFPTSALFHSLKYAVYENTSG